MSFENSEKGLASLRALAAQHRRQLDGQKEALGEMRRIMAEMARREQECAAQIEESEAIQARVEENIRELETFIRRASPGGDA